MKITLATATLLMIVLPVYAAEMPADMSYEEWQKYQEYEKYQEAQGKIQLDAALATFKASAEKKKAAETKTITLGSTPMPTPSASTAIPSTAIPSTTGTFSYNFIELGVLRATVDMGEELDELKGIGFGAGASFAVSDYIAIASDVIILSYDEWYGVEGDGTGFGVTLVGHAPISPRADIVGSFGIIRINTELTNTYGETISESDTAKNLALGMRFMPNQAIELNAGFSKDPTDSESDLTTNIGLRTNTKKQASFGVAISTSKDVFTVGVDLRINI